MIKIGTIGTSEICKEFILTAKLNPNLNVLGCYSRSKERAKEFILELGIKARAFDNFQQLSENVDAIYIASPNGLHFEQAMYFISQQKHVLLEKPITLSFEQALQLHEAAMKNKVILMEALKIIHLPQFNYLDDFNKKYSPFAASFNLNKFSSRMNDVKKGIYKSVFDERLGKGSTYDMLVYPVELAVALFGPALEIKSFSTNLPNGVSHTNSVLLKHNSGIVTNILCSKSAHGIVGSEIISDEGTISFNNLLKLDEIKLYDISEKKEFILFDHDENPNMKYEIEVFTNMVLEEDFQLCDYLLKLSCETVRILNFIENEK